jgi:hypothetical protein
MKAFFVAYDVRELERTIKRSMSDFAQNGN